MVGHGEVVTYICVRILATRCKALDTTFQSLAAVNPPPLYFQVTDSPPPDEERCLTGNLPSIRLIQLGIDSGYALVVSTDTSDSVLIW